MHFEVVNFVATTHPLGQKRCRRVLRLPECQFYRKGVGALLTPFFLMPKRAGVAEDAAAARRISGKIQEYLQEQGKRNA